jgi:putative addiction module component (TIGR02574 family)
VATKLEELAVELLALPASERALLAKQLILSLEESRASDSEALWLEEAERRSRELSEGTVKGAPAEEVFERARRQFR